MDSQIIVYGRTGQSLCRLRRRAVLVRFTEPSRILKPKRRRVVQERVEYSRRVEYERCSDILMSLC